MDKDEFLGTLRLGVGHSLVIGNVPNIVEPVGLSNILLDNSTAEVASFGLFETSTPNYNTYYPDATAEDLSPNEDEFINPVFRLLSEVIVYKGAPFDFSKPGVLKKSMPKLLGQTVNVDHETMVGNAIGAVSKVYWQESYKTKSGKVVPAGINGILKIDGKSNPRIARGIMMKPPSIHSNSVTLHFKWEPSHTFENMEEFYRKLGTYDDKGQLIRCVVNEIRNYSETSLVSHGADPYAQIEQEGEIINPEYAANVARFSAETLKESQTYYDIKDESTFKLDSTIPKGTNNNNISNKTTIRMEELIKELTTGLGFQEKELTSENLGAKLIEAFAAKDTTIGTLKDSTSSLESEKTNLSQQLTELQGKYDTLESNSAETQEALKLTREEATRLFKLAKGENADENILEMIAGADLKMSAAFVKQYRGEVDEKFSATCGDCGSENVSRKSAGTSKEGLKTDDDENDKGGKGNGSKTNAEVIAKFKSTKKRKSRIFGEDNK